MTWTATSGSGSATISNASGSRGLATATSTGSVTIAATSGTVTGGTGLTVVDNNLGTSWTTALSSPFLESVTSDNSLFVAVGNNHPHL